MGPYLAVIKDSFREAMASRILWVLLVIITLVLALLSPWGYSESTTTTLQDGDLINFADFVTKIDEAGKQSKKTPARRIWERLGASERKSLTRFKPGENADGFDMMKIASNFIRSLNKSIKSDDFYDAEYWADSRLRSEEGRDLLKRLEDGETLSKNENGRLNRLALEAAFPDVIRTGMPTSLQFTYINSPVGPPFPISREDYDQIVTQWASWVMKWFVGVVGVVIAILVTASIIPQMFDPGSLHLLLSNPISRSLLFLSKYIGGCAFTSLSAAYLVGGMWFLLGIRFGIWQLSLLYCIPLFVFVFAIYYAVSALAGVIWRHPLISIALSILFWLICLLMGYLKGGYEQFALESTQFAQIHQAGDSLLGVNQAGVVRQWNGDENEWEEVFASEGQLAMQMIFSVMPEVPAELRPIGPVYDAQEDRLVNISRDMQRGGGSPKVMVGKREDNWDPKTGVAPPSATTALLREPDGGVLAVSYYNLYRLTGDPTKKAKPKKSETGILSTLRSFIPDMTTGPFKPVGPERAVLLTRPYAAAIDPATGDLVLCSRGHVTVLSKDQEGMYDRKVEGDIDVPSSKPITLGATGGNILVGREDGSLLLYDSELELRKEFNPESRSASKWVSNSPDGKTFAVTFNNGNLWVVNADEEAIAKPNIRGQGDISATLFTNDANLMATYQSVRLCETNLESMEIVNSYAPSMGTMEIAYRYVIYPLYVVFPKPSEMNRTIDFALAKEEEANKIERPYEPLWSSLLFIVGVLIISCIYVERQEF